jgi:hypothetical protein
MDAEAERMAVVDSVMEKCIAKLLRGLRDRSFTRWVNLVLRRKHMRKVAEATMEQWASQRSLTPLLFGSWKTLVTQQKLRKQKKLLDQMRSNMEDLKEQLAADAAKPKDTTRPPSEQLVDGGKTQELESQVAAAQEKIRDLERNLAWSGDTTMALSIAHEKDNQRVAEMAQQKEHLQLEVVQLKKHTDSLERDLATAGVLAAEMMCAGMTAVNDEEMADRFAVLQAAFDEKNTKLRQLEIDLKQALDESEQLKEAHSTGTAAMREEIRLLQQEIRRMQDAHAAAHKKLMAHIALLEEASERDLEALTEADANIAREHDARLIAEKALALAMQQRDEEVASLQQQHAEVVQDVQRVLLEMDGEMGELLGEDISAAASQLLMQVKASAQFLDSDRSAAVLAMGDRSVYLTEQLGALKARHLHELSEAEARAGVEDGEPWQVVDEVRERHKAEISELHSHHAGLAQDKEAKLQTVER